MSDRKITQLGLPDQTAARLEKVEQHLVLARSVMDESYESLNQLLKEFPDEIDKWLAIPQAERNAEMERALQFFCDIIDVRNWISDRRHFVSEYKGKLAELIRRVRRGRAAEHSACVEY